MLFRTEIKAFSMESDYSLGETIKRFSTSVESKESKTLRLKVSFRRDQLKVVHSDGSVSFSGKLRITNENPILEGTFRIESSYWPETMAVLYYVVYVFLRNSRYYDFADGVAFIPFLLPVIVFAYIVCIHQKPEWKLRQLEKLDHQISLLERVLKGFLKKTEKTGLVENLVKIR